MILWIISVFQEYDSKASDIPAMDSISSCVCFINSVSSLLEYRNEFSGNMYIHFTFHLPIYFSENMSNFQHLTNKPESWLIYIYNTWHGSRFQSFSIAHVKIFVTYSRSVFIKCSKIGFNVLWEVFDKVYSNYIESLLKIQTDLFHFNFHSDSLDALNEFHSQFFTTQADHVIVGVVWKSLQFYVVSFSQQQLL